MWQLGILIFYCLSGTYPFYGTEKQLFQKILNGKFEYDPTEWDHISTNGKVRLSFERRFLDFFL